MMSPATTISTVVAPPASSDLSALATARVSSPLLTNSWLTANRSVSAGNAAFERSPLPCAGKVLSTPRLRTRQSAASVGAKASAPGLPRTAVISSSTLAADLAFPASVTPDGAFRPCAA